MAKIPKPTESEIEILSVLWEHGPVTVREVYTQLNKRRIIGYTTVLKLMQIMTEKGLLLRDESQRSHIYRPKQKPEAMQQSIVRDVVVKVFSGSTERLVLQALSSRKATPQQIAEIQRMLTEIETGDQEEASK